MRHDRFELPPTMTLEVPRGTLLLCHGIGENDMKQLGPDDGGYASELHRIADDLSVSPGSRAVL
jgi:hypothetical protein